MSAHVPQDATGAAAFWMQTRIYAELGDGRDELDAIRAWQYLEQHPRLHELTEQDYATIIDDLKPKIDCYGFGAVVQLFELEDALQKVLNSKGRSPSLSMAVS